MLGAINSLAHKPCSVSSQFGEGRDINESEHCLYFFVRNAEIYSGLVMVFDYKVTSKID